MKRSKKLSKRITGRPLHEVLTGIVLIVAILLVAAFIKTAIDTHQSLEREKAIDTQYFTRLRTNIDNADSAIMSESTRKLKIDAINACYNKEQGVFNDGRLHCNVSRAYYVTVNSEADALSAAHELIPLVTKQLQVAGLKGTAGLVDTSFGGIYLSPESSGYMEDGRSTCHFELSYPIITSPAYYLPEKTRGMVDQLRLAFSCGGRSSEKVFEYIP